MEALVLLVIVFGLGWLLSRRFVKRQRKRSDRVQVHLDEQERQTIVQTRRVKASVSSSDAWRLKRPGSETSVSKRPVAVPLSTVEPPLSTAGKATRWIRSGEQISLNGRSIGSGMIYVGTDLPSPRHHYRPDNCLVDPTLPISNTTSDWSGAFMPYWPSYSELSPEQRRAYLDWLASGRSEPGIGIGYVFLFFYGLERRLFYDLARDESPLLIAEVQRLLALYGKTNDAFRRYAQVFLHCASCMNGEMERFHIEPDLELAEFEMPVPVRIYLGRCLQRGTPLSEDEALVWALSHPEISLRTPATRCFDELRSLWRHRFSAQYPKGFSVTAPKTRLRLSYQAASSSFECELPVGNGDVPDVLALKARSSRLQDLIDACTDQLDGYSRFLGKKPDARGTLEAAALLPREIMMEAGGDRLAAIKTQLDRRLSEKNHAVMQIPNLLEALQIDAGSTSKLSASTASQVASILDRIDVGFEPDRRYGGSTPAIDGRIILFRATGGGAIDNESLAFRSARTMVEIGAIASAADGSVASEEIESVKSDLQAIPDLSALEKQRLMALAVLLLKDAPGQAAVLKKLASLPESEKRRVTQSAITAVLADGHVSPAEVKFIEKLHKSLGYPVENVFAALHRGSVVADEPVSIAPAETGRGISIPQSPEVGEPTRQSQPQVVIDQARLERIRSETVAVSSLLSDIFSEDIPEDPQQDHGQPPVSGSDENATPFSGLDDAHASLLETVVSRRSMSRESFEARARELKLLPDGAIETINEWGFDRFDEVVLEDDDGIRVVEHLLSELQIMEDAA